MRQRRPWITATDVDLGRRPTAADADRLSALAVRAETGCDCASLERLGRGDVVELRCVSSLGRSPWLETTADDVVGMDWAGSGHVVPDVEPAAVAQPDMWLGTAAAPEVAGEASAPAPLAAAAPSPAALSRRRSAGTRSALRAAALPPSAVQRPGGHPPAAGATPPPRRAPPPLPARRAPL